ncbi:uncharacterized protein LOC118435144 isoform X1 [Folsomia candida]|uniref:uncharacterized protein LOC118435144 isoform X1 n=1 Tax=Folsomia candida TaxID=158441 RepID=UPI0016054AE1|nr:uncharacterized protein LOC118435144 isoform X1 [Folsomia candida]
MRFRRLVFSLMFLLVPSGSVVSVPIPVEITRDVPLDNLISLFHKSPSSQASDEHDLFLEEESLNTKHSSQRKRILRMTPTKSTKTRIGKSLTSIQKKFWWPFKRNKELVVTKSLSHKRKNGYEDGGWSNLCEGHHCSCDHYTDHCHHHHHQNRPPSTSIGYVHHIHHNNQQQQLLFSPGSGRSNPQERVIARNTNPSRHPPQQFPTSAEEIAHDKREVNLIREKIRLKEEIQRLRNSQRWKDGVKQVHHYHGPTHLYNHNGPSRRRRKKHPSYHHEDNSSSEEDDDDELTKKLKLAEAQKKIAKVQLLASLLSQFGVGGAVPDLLHHGISQIPNNFQAGYPFGPYVSLGPSHGHDNHGNHRPPQSGGSGTSTVRPTQNPTTTTNSPSTRPTTTSLPPTHPNPITDPPQTTTTPSNQSSIMIPTLPTMTTITLPTIPSTNASTLTTPRLAPQLLPPNPAVLLAAQILLEDSLDEEVDNINNKSSEDDESGSDELDRIAENPAQNEYREY